MKLHRIALSGSVVSAIASSACCWLPLALVGAGVSAVGVGAFFDRHRPLLLGVSALLLAIGFASERARARNCEPGSACATQSGRARLGNRLALGLATVAVVVFALFPRYVNDLMGAGAEHSTAAVAELTTWTVNIHGMTCTGCESAVEGAVRSVPGVVDVRASHALSNAVITTSPGQTARDAACIAAIRSLGYEVTESHPAP